MLPEVEYYQEASREIERGQLHEATWSRALDISRGDPIAAKYQYMLLRVESLASGEELPPVQAVPAPAGSTEDHSGNTDPGAARPQLMSVREEEDFYSVASSELDEGDRDEKTWIIALVLAEGDARAARHHYICLRMDTLNAQAARVQPLEKSGT